MNVIFIILFYIYPSDSQESDGGANTQDSDKYKIK